LASEEIRIASHVHFTENSRGAKVEAEARCLEREGVRRETLAPCDAPQWVTTQREDRSAKG